MKALSTATCALSVRVVEYEFTLDLIVYEVHFRANNEHQGPFVDYDADSALLDDFIELPYLFLLHVVHHIWVAITSAPADINLHSIDVLFILFLVHQFLYSWCGPLSDTQSLFFGYLSLLFHRWACTGWVNQITMVSLSGCCLHRWKISHHQRDGWVILSAQHWGSRGMIRLLQKSL